MSSLRNALCTLAGAVCVATAQTVFLAGDSTMVDSGNNDGTQGWGAFLPNYLSLAVDNDAIAGRSARSFTREGRFDAMADNVQSGDFVGESIRVLDMVSGRSGGLAAIADLLFNSDGVRTQRRRKPYANGQRQDRL